MVKCEALTTSQLKQMCKIKIDRYPKTSWEHDFFKKEYVGYSTLYKDKLVPKCCGDPNDWVNPHYTKQLSGTLHRQLNRPKGTLTGMQFIEWIRDNLEHDGLVRTSSMSGGEMRGWTTSFGSTGYSIRKMYGPYLTGFDHAKINKGDIDMHLDLSGKEIGLTYRKYTEWEDDRGEMTFHDPINPDKINPKIKKTLERLGLNAKEIRHTGSQTYWDDDVSYNVLMTRPKYLSDKNK